MRGQDGGAEGRSLPAYARAVRAGASGAALLFAAVAVTAVVLAPSSAWSQGPAPAAAFAALPEHELSTTQDPSAPVRVGDKIDFALGAEGLPKGAGVPMPEDAARLRREGWVFVKTEGLGFTLAPIKSGRLTVPSLPIVAQGPDARGPVARTRPFVVEVQSSFAQGEKKPDPMETVKPPVALAFPWWFLAGAGILVVALLGGALYWLKKWSEKRRLAATRLSPEPPRPEDAVALEAIAELEKQDLMGRGEFKRHYFRISEILKHYLGARFEFDAPERTTGELIAALETRPGAMARDVDAVQSLFERLDRVKFTDHVPDRDEGKTLLESARKLVQSTRRSPVAASPAGEPAFSKPPGGSGAV